GLEPATFAVTGRRANQLRHRAMSVFSYTSAPNGIRTRVAALKGRSPRPLDDGSPIGSADRPTALSGPPGSEHQFTHPEPPLRRGVPKPRTIPLTCEDSIQPPVGRGIDRDAARHAATTPRQRTFDRRVATGAPNARRPRSDRGHVIRFPTFASAMWKFSAVPASKTMIDCLQARITTTLTAGLPRCTTGGVHLGNRTLGAAPHRTRRHRHDTVAPSTSKPYRDIAGADSVFGPVPGLVQDCSGQRCPGTTSALTSALHRRTSTLVRRQPEHVQQARTVLHPRRPMRHGEPGPAHLIVRDPWSLLADPLRGHTPVADAAFLSLVSKEELPYLNRPAHDSSKARSCGREASDAHESPAAPRRVNY